VRARAESELETRQRIVEATIDLHQTRGPAMTSMADIAERAGVGRVTVYRHFPDPDLLARACSGLYFERHPAPDIDRWQTIADPRERLRLGLGEAYALHRATRAMMTRVLAQACEHEVVQPYHDYWRRATDVLVGPFKVRGRRRDLQRAAIALALSFDTWRSLARDHDPLTRGRADGASPRAGRALWL
jgi:AcrR family transcriptional regulator